MLRSVPFMLNLHPAMRCWICTPLWARLALRQWLFYRQHFRAIIILTPDMLPSPLPWCSAPPRPFYFLTSFPYCVVQRTHHPSSHWFPPLPNTFPILCKSSLWNPHPSLLAVLSHTGGTIRMLFIHHQLLVFWKLNLGCLTNRSNHPGQLKRILVINGTDTSTLSSATH